MRSRNITYLPEVDHLRAVAALWILLYHGFVLLGPAFADPVVPLEKPGSTLLVLVSEGHTSVALFMVLSGFIFTVGAFRREVDYGSFMVNRLLRIYPLYLSLVFLSLAVHPKGYSLDALLSMVLPLADVKMLDVVPVVGMSWAIAVEFQFYLIFPFLVRFLGASPARTVAGVVVTAVVYRGLGYLLGGSAQDLGYWHIVGRIDQFVLGMGAAAALSSAALRAGVLRILAPLAALSAVAAVLLFHRWGGLGSNAPWRILWPSVEGLCWAAVIYTYVGAGYRMNRVVSGVVAKIGETSFSMYLLHFPIVTILVKQKERLPAPFGSAIPDAMLNTVLVAVPVVLAVSTLTYHVIERPFLDLRRRYIRLPSTAA